MPPLKPFSELGDDVMKHAVAVFGEYVTYVPRAGAQFRIKAVFDRMWEGVDPDTEQVVSSNQPMIGVRDADMPNPAVKGDRVLRDNGKHYRVVDSQEDGIAGTRLMLHEVSA